MKKITLVLVACFMAMAANAIIYVKPAAEGGADTNDGASWATAKATVAAAIKVTTNTDRTVFVKGGTYTEDGWSITLQAGGGNKIYGGFAGTETTIEARVKGTKAWEFTNASKFTFTKGSPVSLSVNATEAAPVIIDGFTFQNCVLSDNVIVNLRGYSTLQNCTVINNVMTGKAVVASFGSAGPVKVLGCYFQKNTSDNNNVLDMSSSGANSPVTIDGCVFEENISTKHQLVNLKNPSPSVFSNNILFNNEAAGNIVNATADISTVVNCVVFNNKATNAVNAGTKTETLIINTTIVNNIGSLTLTNATAKIHNSIVRGNTNAAGVSLGITGNFASTVNNCAIDAALPALVAAANNLMYGTKATGFVAPSTFIGHDVTKATELAATNWALTNEPHNMMNAGNNAAFLAAYGDKDLNGAARVQQTTIDMGAIESEFTPLALPTLTIVAGANGTVSTEKGGQYRMGEGVAVTSTPDKTYKLKEWKVGETVVSTSKNFTFSTPATSSTLTATFEKSAQFDLTIVAGANGTASTDKSGKYYVDEEIELVATPITDYVFIGWFKADTLLISNAATYTYTMPEEAVTLTAKFKYKLNRYLIAEKGLDQWARETIKGETIINLNEVNKSFEEYVNGNMWPTPLSEGDEIWLLGVDYQLFEGLEFTAEGVKWYGGFTGVETSINQREKQDLDLNGIVEPWEFLYQTTFKGDFSIDRVGTILKMNEGILVDGVTIAGGYQGPVDYAAGVRVGPNKAGAKRSTLRNSIVKENSVGNAGATSAYNCGAVVEHNGLVEYCLIENNTFEATCTGATYGAGITAPRPGAEIRNCVIRNNRNLGTSGGLNHGGGAKVDNGTITNCIVYNNTATRGGGIYAGDSSVGVISYCTVVNNHSVSFKESNPADATGGGVYFRGKDNGGNMFNSIVWGNTSATKPEYANIHIETDAWTGAKVVLGGNAYNGGSDAITGANYSKAYGEEKSIRDLAATGVFKKATETAGYLSASTWEGIDWRPTLASLKVASKQLEEAEYDFFGNVRSEETPTYGAFEFGSEPSSIDKPSALEGVKIYTTNGAIRVNNENPVTVTVYNALGMKVALKAAATDHVINLQGGYYIVSVQDANNASNTTKVVVR